MNEEELKRLLKEKLNVSLDIRMYPEELVVKIYWEDELICKDAINLNLLQSDQ
jgi:hypothetical protein